MIRSVCYDPGTGARRIGGEELLAAWDSDSDQFVWVDFCSEEREHERELLRERFGIDELSLDDCQRDRHPPKLEWFDDYFFLLLKGFSADTDSIDYDIVHISFFAGRNFLATRHAGPSPSIDRIWSLMEAGKLDLESGPAHVTYRVVRAVIDRYSPIILEMEQKLDTLEEQMLENPTDQLLGNLITYNSNLKKLRRIFASQAKALDSLRDPDPDIVSDVNEHEFADAHEHMERLASLCGLLQELTSDLINGYISVSSHRLNNILRVLTIVTVVFMPLTLLAGIYGMNFVNMPELKDFYGYYFVLGGMGIIAVGLLALFKILKWL